MCIMAIARVVHLSVQSWPGDSVLSSFSLPPAGQHGNAPPQHPHQLLPWSVQTPDSRGCILWFSLADAAVTLLTSSTLAATMVKHDDEGIHRSLAVFCAFLSLDVCCPFPLQPSLLSWMARIRACPLTSSLGGPAFTTSSKTSSSSAWT